MEGDYTASILVGPQQQPMNVILDTGSSALALDGKKYTPNLAGGDQTTDLAQTDAYGDNSSWTGAVIKTRISVGQGNSAVALNDANASVAYQASPNMFNGSDGILGLAYAPLDDAFSMPQNTWAHKFSETQVRAGKHGDIQPYLTQLAGEGITSDIISFLTHRSFIHAGNGGLNDPLNQGWMVVGGGEECTDLYTGGFANVKVVSDDWYSTTLKAVVVGTSDPISARMQGPKGAPSNSIVDSGTNSLCMSRQMLDAFLSKFTAEQQALLTKSISGKSVSNADLNLAAWPALTFILEGDTGDVSLKVAPSDYWQVDTEEVGAAAVAISEGDPGFTILGLPLMNGYFTVFDGEAAGGLGLIRFASKKA